jgi:hypothetical protein
MHRMTLSVDDAQRGLLKSAVCGILPLPPPPLLLLLLLLLLHAGGGGQVMISAPRPQTFWFSQ